MASSRTVLSNNSLVSRLDRILHKLESLMALLAGLAVFSLIVLAVFNVAGRHFFGAPLLGYIDWIEQLMPLIAFLGIAFCQRNGGHIRMDILIGRLHNRPLWFLECLLSFLTLLLLLLLLWGSFEHFQRSFDINAPYWSRDSSVDIRLPLWPAKLLAPIAFFVLSLRLLLQLWGYGLAFWNGNSFPVAVPLIQDPAAQAAQEAHSVLGSQTHNG